MQAPEKLMIIDGNSIINRAFYAIRPLTTKDGTPTNAIYGFLNILYKYLSDYNPSYICVAFDLPQPTFRHLKYEGYKAQRKKMPEELAVQMPILKEILRAMNLCILEKEGFEADDIIGTVSVLCEEKDVDCYIVTGDRDDLQLATQHVRICLTTTAKGQTTTTVYDDEAVQGKYGVSPRDLIEVKALQGDSSDNIPGVPGIGEKGALDLVKKYHTLEEIYANLSEDDFRPAMLKKLKEGRELAFLSRELGTIDVHVPLDFSLPDAKKQEENTKELLALYHQLEFRGFAKKLSMQMEKEDASDPHTQKSAVMLTSVASLEEKLQMVKKQFIYKMFYRDGKWIGFSFLSEDTIYYIGVSDQPENEINAIRSLMENDTIVKITHDVKTDFIYLYSQGIRMQAVGFDTMIAAYILEPSFSQYDIATISREFLTIDIPDYGTVLCQGKEQLSLLADHTQELDRSLCGYSEKIMGAIVSLMEYEKETMTDRGQLDLFYQIELPLADVLADMQINGIQVDVDRLKEFNAMLDEKIAELTSDIYALAGEEFNINSSKQLGVILFEKLQLPVVKKTKTGYSTNVDVLEKLMPQHPIIERIMEYRKDAKLKSTYCDGLLAVIHPTDGRIHSTFNQTVAVTGRISSTDPNMQNIPVRTPLGREMRKMFVAQQGYTLIDADYSQIELRVLAHIAEDETMINGFANQVDIHALTASQVFDTPLAEVTKEMRSAAKAVNFGIVYGIGEYSLSQDIHVSVKEAKRYIDQYLAKYNGVRTYMENIKQAAKEQGYVETLFGRRRYIPEMRSKNFNLRAFGERVALNTPIQGTAADIIKIAMVRVQNRLERECPKAHLVLQVHDELIIESPDENVEAASRILQEEMEQAASLKVKLVVDLKCGHSWYDTK